MYKNVLLPAFFNVMFLPFSQKSDTCACGFLDVVGIRVANYGKV